MQLSLTLRFIAMTEHPRFLPVYARNKLLSWKPKTPVAVLFRDQDVYIKGRIPRDLGTPTSFSQTSFDVDVPTLLESVFDHTNHFHLVSSAVSI